MGLQKRLFAKEPTKKTSHTQKYLKNGGRRVYTDPGFREARRRDQEEAADKDLEKIRNATLCTITGRRTAW